MPCGLSARQEEALPGSTGIPARRGISPAVILKGVLKASTYYVSRLGLIDSA